jgi:hypothetical protein
VAVSLIDALVPVQSIVRVKDRDLGHKHSHIPIEIVSQLRLLRMAHLASAAPRVECCGANSITRPKFVVLPLTRHTRCAPRWTFVCEMLRAVAAGAFS